MRRSTRIITALSIVVVAIAGLTFTVVGEEAKLKVAPKVGFLAPSFELEDPSGEMVSLESFKGKAVIVNFWATWCPPCRAEMPDFQAFYEENKDKGLVIIGIDQAEDARKVSKFLEEFETKITYQILLDRRQKVSRDYRIFGLPSSFFIDREGVVQAVWPGFMNLEVIEKNAAKILGEQPAES